MKNTNKAFRLPIDFTKDEKLTELYYSTRSVVKDDKLIAKRKKRTDELTLVNKPKKIKSKK